MRTPDLLDRLTEEELKTFSQLMARLTTTRQLFLVDPAKREDGSDEHQRTIDRWTYDGGDIIMWLSPDSLASEVMANPTAPPPPWPIGAYNARREGWNSYFAGLNREDCPFPLGREDLQSEYRIGWDAAKRQNDKRCTPIPVVTRPVPQRDDKLAELFR